MENTLYCGDNLDILKDIQKESVDLIYIDPPFFSNRQYEVIWGDEAEIRSFEDRWEGGINVYIEWMRPRIEELYRILKPVGSFYLHCDWHANAYLRIMLDEIFGEKNFRNEISWRRSQTRSSISKIFKRAYDILLFYSKSKNYKFNIQYKELSEASKALYAKIDNKGYHRLVPLVVSGIRKGETGKPWRGIDPNTRGKSGSHWITIPQKLEEYEKKNLIVWPQKEGGLPQLKYYLHKNKGVPVTDFWDDIDLIQPSSIESLGYPTQKPEKLLGRIIKASSNKEDIVLDAFCGCGTALVVAQKLGRNWIGIDISPTAVQIMKNRLEQIGARENEQYISIGMPTTINDLKKLKPFEFQNWVVNKMGARQSRKKVGDMGIDGYFVENLFHNKAGIQVKQSDKVGRNVVDNFETALKRGKYNKGYIIAFSFTKGACEEVARLKHKGELEIELIKIEDLIKGKKIF